MAVIRIPTTHCDISNSTYMQLTNAANMYYDTSHTSSYATIRGRGGVSSNSTYYAFVNGFDFSLIPQNAVVNSFKVKIRIARNAFLLTGSSYRMRLAKTPSNSTIISGTIISSQISTTPTVMTLPTGALTWDEIVQCGNGFSIEIRIRNSSTSASDYPEAYVYGAEFEVNYSIVESPADIHSNYYIMTSHGGWSPCIEGNNAHGLRPFAGSVLPNCSGYATGRFNELLGLGACTWLGSYNGAEFVEVAYSQGLGTGWNPVAGGIIAWGDPGSEGHVAVVEQVIDNDTIITSESGWGYSAEPLVRQYTRTRGANGRWGWGEECKGFAYPPGVPGQYVDYYMLFLEDD